MHPRKRGRKEGGSLRPFAASSIQRRPLGESSRSSTARNRGHEKSSGALGCSSDLKRHILWVCPDGLVGPWVPES